MSANEDEAEGELESIVDELERTVPEGEPVERNAEELNEALIKEEDAMIAAHRLDAIYETLENQIGDSGEVFEEHDHEDWQFIKREKQAFDSRYAADDDFDGRYSPNKIIKDIDHAEDQVNRMVHLTSTSEDDPEPSTEGGLVHAYADHLQNMATRLSTEGSSIDIDQEIDFSEVNRQVKETVLNHSAALWQGQAELSREHAEMSGQLAEVQTRLRSIESNIESDISLSDQISELKQDVYDKIEEESVDYESEFEDISRKMNSLNAKIERYGTDIDAEDLAEVQEAVYDTKTDIQSQLDSIQDTVEDTNDKARRTERAVGRVEGVARDTKDEAEDARGAAEDASTTAAEAKAEAEDAKDAAESAEDAANDANDTAEEVKGILEEDDDGYSVGRREAGYLAAGGILTALGSWGAAFSGGTSGGFLGGFLGASQSGRNGSVVRDEVSQDQVEQVIDDYSQRDLKRLGLAEERQELFDGDEKELVSAEVVYDRSKKPTDSQVRYTFELDGETVQSDWMTVEDSYAEDFIEVTK